MFSVHHLSVVVIVVIVVVVVNHLRGRSSAKSIAREPEQPETFEPVEGGDRDVRDPTIVQVQGVEVRDGSKGTWRKRLEMFFFTCLHNSVTHTVRLFFRFKELCQVTNTRGVDIKIADSKI